MRAVIQLLGGALKFWLLITSPLIVVTAALALANTPKLGYEDKLVYHWGDFCTTHYTVYRIGDDPTHEVAVARDSCKQNTAAIGEVRRELSAEPYRP